MPRRFGNYTPMENAFKVTGALYQSGEITVDDIMRICECHRATAQRYMNKILDALPVTEEWRYTYPIKEVTETGRTIHKAMRDKMRYRVAVLINRRK